MTAKFRFLSLRRQLLHLHYQSLGALDELLRACSLASSAMRKEED